MRISVLLLLAPLSCFETDAASSGDVEELNQTIADAADEIEDLQDEIGELNDRLCHLSEDDCDSAAQVTPSFWAEGHEP